MSRFFDALKEFLQIDPGDALTAIKTKRRGHDVNWSCVPTFEHVQDADRRDAQRFQDAFPNNTLFSCIRVYPDSISARVLQGGRRWTYSMSRWTFQMKRHDDEHAWGAFKPKHIPTNELRRLGEA